MTSAPQTQPPAHAVSPFLLVQDLRKHFGGVNALDGVDFSLDEGEIHALVGENGAGKSTLIKILTGVYPYDSGSIRFAGEPFQPTSPNDAKSSAAGIGFVTEDRKDEGLVLEMPIAANISLVSLAEISRRALIDFSRERRQACEVGARLTLKYGATSDPVSSLSGGNQQKVVVAKWLAGNPKVLILDEPTRGVDVGAKFEIYSILKRLAGNGVAMLIVSSEMPELMTLADRIMVLAEHKPRGTLTRAEFSEENILRLAYGQQSRAEGMH